MPIKEETSGGKVSEKHDFLSFCTQHSKKFILGAVIIAGACLAALGGLWSVYKNVDKNVLAVVGNQPITKADLNKAIYGRNFLGSADKPEISLTDAEREDLLSSMIERSIAKQEAPKLGVSVTAAEVDDYIANYVTDYSKYNAEQKAQTRETSESYLLLEKVKKAVAGSRSGSVAVVRFDRAYQANLANKDIVYTSDKAYAQTLASSLYGKVSAGTMTIDQAMETADADKVVGKSAWSGAYTFSFKFNENDSQSKGILASSPDFWDKLFALKEGVSEPQMAKITLDEKEGTKDGFYFVAKIDKVSAGAQSYSTWLTQKVKEYNVGLREE